MSLESIQRTWFELEDRWFDWRHGIDTRGIVPAQALEGPHQQAARHATAYQAVWTRNLRVLLREARQHTSARLFIDIGSGKGKACIYAAPQFEQVIGVEYAEDLLATAHSNQMRSGFENIDFVQADAALYEMPDEAAVVFLFNPFDAVILDRFLSRNAARLRAHQGLVAYANDRERDTLAQHGFECVFRDPMRSLSLWR